MAGALLARALDAMRRQGAPIAEGYPSKPDPSGRYIDTFAWTGTISLFEKAGFTLAGSPGGGRRRMRKDL